MENEKVYIQRSRDVPCALAEESAEHGGEASANMPESTAGLNIATRCDEREASDVTKELTLQLGEAVTQRTPEVILQGRGTGTKLRLIVLLICTLLCTLAVIVYGVSLSGALRDVKTPLAERLLSEVFSTGITTLGTSYVRVPLKRIPSQTVVEGDDAGAAEHESVNDEENADTDDGVYEVRSVDLSVSADDVFAIISDTPYEPDTVSLYAEESPIPSLSALEEKYGEGAPVVLILHTHGTEGYLPDGAATYSGGESFRTYNMERNVVALGRSIAQALREEGVGVVHLEEMFDADDYNSAYYYAAREIERQLERYPSISYVFDIHRDAMITEEKVCLKPTSPLEVNGQAAAQMMLVVGTDYAGSGHTSWEDNLSVALKLQKAALGINGGIMRAINLRSASFNGQYTAGSMIVEVGAAGNSLTEAYAAGKIFAAAAAKVIKGE